MKRSACYILFLICLSLAVFQGCEGEAGLPGVSRLPQDLQSPQVLLLMPDPLKEIHERTILEVYATDDDTVVRVDFLIDGRLPANQNLVINEPPWQLRWDCSGLTEGSHTIQARAWDRVGSFGLSPVMIIQKSNEPGTTRDTLRSYIDLGFENNYFWQLPDDLGRYEGIGVRFSPVTNCVLLRFFVNIYFRGTWTGTRMFSYEIWSSRNNSPDSLLFAVEKNAFSLTRNSPDVSYWGTITVTEEIEVDDDFFVLIKPTDDLPEDTLIFFTDDGNWRNFKGVFQQDDAWKGTSEVVGGDYNPLIHMIVNYR